MFILVWSFILCFYSFTLDFVYQKKWFTLFHCYVLDVSPCSSLVCVQTGMKTRQMMGEGYVPVTYHSVDHLTEVIWSQLQTNVSIHERNTQLLNSHRTALNWDSYTATDANWIFGGMTVHFWHSVQLFWLARIFTWAWGPVCDVKARGGLRVH